MVSVSRSLPSHIGTGELVVTLKGKHGAVGLLILAGLPPIFRLYFSFVFFPLNWLWVKTNGAILVGIGEFTSHFRLPFLVVGCSLGMRFGF